MCRQLIYAAVLFLLSVSGMAAQPGPRVGVVLSGGGAKGYAHVGALRAIEEAGIRIDYIAGTSMGAIVGGLYAAGYTANELDSILRYSNIKTLMQDRIPRPAKPFFEKEYGENYMLSLSVKDFKISLPTALSNGQNIYNFLTRLTYGVSNIKDFRLLPVPFFAIGTDVATGEQVLLEKGSLAKAMRASGAFPGLLSPVEVDGHLITDGGIVNNFPAKELKEKGVDIVIGVSVEQGLYSAEELYSIDKIIEQIGSYQMVRHSKEQLSYCDILIQPDIKGFSIISFEAIDTLIKNGYGATRLHWDKLTQIAATQKDIDSRHKTFSRPIEKDTFNINYVEVQNSRVFSKGNVLDFFPEKIPGRITREQFYHGITHIYGTGNFQYVDYTLYEDENAEAELYLNPIPKRGYDRQLKVGLHYDNVYKSSLLLNLTFLNLGVKNTTTSLNLILGDEFRYTFNYLLDRGKKVDLGFNSRLFFNEVPVVLPLQSSLDSNITTARLNFNFNDFSNEFYLRLWSSNEYAVGLRAQLKHFNFDTDQLLSSDVENLFVGERGLYLSGAAYWKMDSRDHRQFPSRGVLISANSRLTYPLKTKIYEEGENRLGYNFDMDYQWFIPTSPRLTLGIGGTFGFTLGQAAPPFFYFIGGNNQNFINNFKPLIGLSYSEMTGIHFLKSELLGRYQLLKNHYLTLIASAAHLSEDTYVFEGLEPDIYAVGLGYGIRTPLGPIELTYAISTESSHIYFNLGYWF